MFPHVGLLRWLLGGLVAGWVVCTLRRGQQGPSGRIALQLTAAQQGADHVQAGRRAAVARRRPPGSRRGGACRGAHRIPGPRAAADIAPAGPGAPFPTPGNAEGWPPARRIATGTIGGSWQRGTSLPLRVAPVERGSPLQSPHPLLHPPSSAQAHPREAVPGTRAVRGRGLAGRAGIALAAQAEPEHITAPERSVQTRVASIRAAACGRCVERTARRHACVLAARDIEVRQRRRLAGPLRRARDQAARASRRRSPFCAIASAARRLHARAGGA